MYQPQAVIIIPPLRREALKRQAEDVWLQDDLDPDTWRRPNLTEAGFLIDFLNGNYTGAPKKMWRSRVGTRTGYDNDGVYIHEQHRRRYFGLERDKASLVIQEDCPEAVPLFNAAPIVVKDSTSGFLTGMLKEIPTLSDDVRFKVIHASFKRADRNGNGKLSRPELGVVLRRVVRNIKSGEVEEVLRAADADEDGQINYQEFVSWLQRSASHKVKERFTSSLSDDADIVKAVFRLWDRNGDGLIENKRLCKALVKLFPDSTPQRLRALTQCIDCDHSGDIDYDEFVDFLFHRHKRT